MVGTAVLPYRYLRRLVRRFDRYTAGCLSSGPTSFRAPTPFFSRIFLGSGLVPRPLAAFGIASSVMVFMAGVLDLFGVIESISVAKALIALPSAGFEITLAAWLITKGLAYPERTRNAPDRTPQ